MRILYPTSTLIFAFHTAGRGFNIVKPLPLELEVLCIYPPMRVNMNGVQSGNFRTRDSTIRNLVDNLPRQVGKGGTSNGQDVGKGSSLLDEFEENERKARINAAWEKMNSSVPFKMPKMTKTLTNKCSSAANKPAQKQTPGWMVNLGLASKKASINQGTTGKGSAAVENGTSEEAKRLAAVALSAVRDAQLAAAAAAGKGKIEITEVRDFAGEEIEMKKIVDANSKEAAEKARIPGAPPSALDSILEQIKKKPKLSVLDKTKKDWGEFKEENKGLEDELDAYKKSSNQYLDKVSFLQRTDMREFERERDARLALQAKRRTDMRDDDL
ncbi:LOW QUALITY PROTEIN: uncharacterized protein LOC109838762 [Asparagus officinalis]|uniref:LOW QUALITY PROTEIN: uncharacterized protein LOC109838762 n=1 Tax=Asparagus officinalis TaxID=4686 RepID=UPI00098E0E8B|nr:LOW QUALITY PROTEIN: uncharacterized protein LOC109838762 [Asparagus officinalis]